MNTHTRRNIRDRATGGNRSVAGNGAQESGAFLELYDFAPTPYHTIAPSGIVTNINRKWRYTLGFRKKEVVGKPIFDFIVEEERSAARASFAAKKASRRTFVRGHERHFRTKHGEIRTFITNDFIFRNKMGRVLFVCTTLEDITEKEKIEKELRATNMRLSRALEDMKCMQQRMIENERLNALGQMASGIAHDFNNVLMPILGLSKLILDDSRVACNKQSVKSMLAQIHAAALEAKQIVVRLTSFYKIANCAARCAVDMRKVVSQSLLLTRPKLEEMKGRGIRIGVSIRLGKTPAIMGNVTELREVLVNIMLNAIDAMPAGGTISLRSLREKPWVVVKVRDNGVGMSEETLRHCFDPFFSTKGSAGSGLGLTMVHGIVRRHNGTVVIESRPSEGTVVTIKLPEAKRPPAPAVQTEPAAVTVPPLRILVIDDDPWSRHVLTEFLIPGNHSVTTAPTGGEGVGLFRKQPFDLVITDHAMPDMNGNEVAAAVKKRNPRTPVILLSGLGDVLLEQGSVSSDIDVGLNKPVTQRDLQAAIASAMSKAGSQEHPRRKG